MLLWVFSNKHLNLTFVLIYKNNFKIHMGLENEEGWGGGEDMLLAGTLQQSSCGCSSSLAQPLVCEGVWAAEAVA